MVHPQERNLVDRLKVALASGIRLSSNDATNFRGVNLPSLGRLVGTETGPESEFTTVQPLLQMLEDEAEADPEELREAMMEAVKEFMEENSESLETGEDAINFLEEDELEQALGGNLNFTLEPMDAGTNFLGELPITDHFLNHLPFPPPPPPPDTVSQVGLFKLRLQMPTCKG